MTDSTEEGQRSANMALLTGTLDTQRYGDRTVTHRVVRNGANGLSIQITLLLPGIFEGSYGLPIEFVPGSPGSNQIGQLLAGDRITISARLGWREWPDPRFTGEPGFQRRIKHMVIRPLSLSLAAPDAPLGTCVQLAGVVQGGTRVIRHPSHGSLLLAIANIAVETPLGRVGEPACVSSVEHIPVAIGSHHRDARNLMQVGNRIRVEGAIERYVVELRGPDIDRAQAALDQSWQRQQAALHDPEIRAQEERRYRSRRHQLTIGRYSRIMAGSIALLKGEPVEPAAAQRQYEIYASKKRGCRASHAKT